MTVGAVLDKQDIEIADMCDVVASPLLAKELLDILFADVGQEVIELNVVEGCDALLNSHDDLWTLVRFELDRGHVRVGINNHIVVIEETNNFSIEHIAGFGDVKSVWCSHSRLN